MSPERIRPGYPAVPARISVIYHNLTVSCGRNYGDTNSRFLLSRRQHANRRNVHFTKWTRRGANPRLRCQHLQRGSSAPPGPIKVQMEQDDKRFSLPCLVPCPLPARSPEPPFLNTFLARGKRTTISVDPHDASDASTRPLLARQRASQPGLAVPVALPGGPPVSLGIHFPPCP